MTQPAPQPPIAVPAPAPAPVFKALAAAGLIAPFLSHGATITVNTLLPEGNASQCSLRDAARAISSPGLAVNGCAVASVPPTGNTVAFAPGLSGSISYDGAMSGLGVLFAPLSGLSISGPGANSLTLSCSSNVTAVIGFVGSSNVAADVSVSGLSVRNCPAQYAAFVALNYGGGGSNSGMSLSLTDVVISGNSGQLGGASVSGVNRLSMRRVSIENNAGQLAGGIFALAGGGIDVRDSTISGNTGAGYGGALFASYGDLSIGNVTVSGNTSGDAALALYGSVIGVSHSTIVRNNASNATSHAGLLMFDGRGIGSGRFKSARGGQQKALSVPQGLNNSIVCGNDFSDVQVESNVVANYNLLGVVNPPGSVFGTGNVNGCTSAALNNWLGPLANNGGPTRTHALLNVPGNPAINSGDPAFSGVPNDQTGGNPRTSGGRTDMGAFELTAVAAASTPVPTTSAVGLGALSVALAALGLRRRRKDPSSKG